MHSRNKSEANGHNGRSAVKSKDSPKRVQSMAPIRDGNRDLVLEVLRRNQPISRVDIARRSGLQRSTISSIVDGLIEERWVREGSVVKTERGRRPTMLTMNDHLLLLAADIRPTQAILAVLDLNGRFLGRTVVPIIADPKQGVALIADGMRRLRSNFPGKTWEGVGISLPGRINKSTQRLAWAPNLPWVGFDIRGTLQKALKVQVELENAANACLLSEVWFGHLEGIQNAASSRASLCTRRFSVPSVSWICTVRSSRLRNEKPALASTRMIAEPICTSAREPASAHSWSPVVMGRLVTAETQSDSPAG